MVALSFRVYEETVLMTDAERRRRSLNCFPTVTLLNQYKEFHPSRRLNCISDSYTCSGCSRGEVVEYCELATTNKVSTGWLASWSLRRTWSDMERKWVIPHYIFFPVIFRTTERVRSVETDNCTDHTQSSAKRSIKKPR